jgi:hypothetical protein
MILLQCGIKKYDGKNLKLVAIQHQKNKRAESTQLADPLGITCGTLFKNH